MTLQERWDRWWLSPIGQTVYDALEMSGWVDDSNVIYLPGKKSAYRHDALLELWVGNGRDHFHISRPHRVDFGFMSRRILWRKLRKERSLRIAEALRVAIISERMG